MNKRTNISSYIIAIDIWIISVLMMPLRVTATMIENDPSYNDQNTSSVVIADTETIVFDGWTDENQDNVWSCYAYSDWSEYADEFLLEGVTSSSQAKEISVEVKKLEKTVETVLASSSNKNGAHSSKSYVQVMLAIIQVLSDGKPLPDDPCNVKKYIYPTRKDITAEASIGIIYNRLITCERLHNGKYTKNIADVYNDDQYWKAVVEGVMLTSSYTQQCESYNVKNANDYYNKNKDYYNSINVKPISDFADKVSSHYKATCVNSKFNGTFIWPCKGGSITSRFGYRNSPTAGASSYHRGIDIAGLGYGADILAAGSGTVITASYSSAMGNYIVIDHGDGLCTWYEHSSKLLVHKGDAVTQGQVIAKVGSTGISTGPHLHFGINLNGNYVNPLDYVSRN